MSDCSKHKKEVGGISDMRELATQIGDLHYEAFAELLTHLTDKLEDDCIKDKRAGRVDLATVLYEASKYIRFARFKISQAWYISKPFMNPSTPHQ
jgi:hypothetical protein